MPAIYKVMLSKPGIAALTCLHAGTWVPDPTSASSEVRIEATQGLTFERVAKGLAKMTFVVVCVGIPASGIPACVFQATQTPVARVTADGARPMVIMIPQFAQSNAQPSVTPTLYSKDVFIL